MTDTIFVILSEDADENRHVICWAATDMEASRAVGGLYAEFDATQRALEDPRRRRQDAMNATRDTSLPQIHEGGGHPSFPADHHSWKELQIALARFEAEFADIVRNVLDKQAYHHYSHKDWRPTYTSVAVRRFSMRLDN